MIFGPIFGSISKSIALTVGSSINTTGQGSSSSGLPNQVAQGAQYPSYQDFLAFTKQYAEEPSFPNLFSVHFAAPRVLQNNLTIRGGSQTTRLDPGQGKMRDLLNFYCQSVNLPSKQVTTGAVVDVGAAKKFATAAAYSQLNMTFIISKSQQTRAFFERWVSRMVPDANQYTEFYDNYVCPALRVYKWERGGGQLLSNNPRLSGVVRRTGDPIPLAARAHRVTAMYEIRNCYPYNIGSVQLNNDSSRAMTLTVAFLYERYRVMVEDDYTDDGRFRIASNITEQDSFLPQLINNQGVGTY